MEKGGPCPTPKINPYAIEKRSRIRRRVKRLNNNILREKGRRRAVWWRREFGEEDKRDRERESLGGGGKSMKKVQDVEMGLETDADRKLGEQKRKRSILIRVAGNQSNEVPIFNQNLSL